MERWGGEVGHRGVERDADTQFFGIILEDV
jgi:hypothetical protein